MTKVMTPDEKKARAKAARDFNLHVLLIVNVEEVSVATARAMAWAEGHDGLMKRLNKEPEED